MPDKVVAEDIDKVYNLSNDFCKIVSKVAGYKRMNDYFVDSTVTHRMKNIRVPTYFLCSLDDPFYGPDVIPVNNQNSKTLIAVTKTGGHLCYFTGLFLPTGQWFVEPMFSFFNYFVQNQEPEEQSSLRSKASLKMVNDRGNLKP